VLQDELKKIRDEVKNLRGDCREIKEEAMVTSAAVSALRSREGSRSRTASAAGEAALTGSLEDDPDDWWVQSAGPRSEVLPNGGINPGCPQSTLQLISASALGAALWLGGRPQATMPAPASARRRQPTPAVTTCRSPQVALTLACARSRCREQLPGRLLS